ncbi:MAG: hypothetical protein K2J81_05175 [Treponemataceae bacterium]|nr:hypothetical protein [Treponemataceae bacterium]
MTLDEFYYQVAVKKPLELMHGGKTYNLTYGTDGQGEYLAFGRLHDTPVRYRSVGELLNAVKIENHFLREVLADV